MRIKSKIDIWVSIIIWLAVITILLSVMLVPQNEKIIAYIIGVPTLIFLLWIYFGTYYELRDKYLYCRSGPFFEKIAYEKIKSVRLKKSLLSSMALSIHRIEIKQHGKSYITGTTYISPENREAFMQELILMCNNLEEEEINNGFK